MRSTLFGVSWRSLVGWCVLGLAIVALGDAAIRLAPADTHVAAWWPAAGLAIAVGLRVGPGGVPLAALTTFVASIGANISGGRAVDVSLLFAVANSAEVLVTCVLVMRWTRGRCFDSIADMFRAGTAAFIGAGTAGVLAGATVAGLLDGDFWVTARAVGPSHLAAVLLFLPFADSAQPHRGSWHRVEQLVTGVVLVTVSIILFGPNQTLPLVFVMFPLLVFMAFRQTLHACAAYLILVNVVITAASAQGWGPLVTAVRRDGLAPETTGTMIEVLILSTTAMVYALRITVESRQSAHRSAMRSRRQLSAVIESAHATAIIQTDLDGLITGFNRGAVLMLGYAEAEVVGLHTPALFHDPDEIAARAEELGIDPGFEVFVHQVRGPEHVADRRDWTYLTADGRERVVSLVVSRVDDVDGSPIGFVGIAEDVSAQRKIETLLLQALAQERSLAEQLRGAEALKSDFVSSVSHELRTPMSSVLGYAEILSDLYGEVLGPEGSDIVGRIQSNGRRLLSLVDDLLTLSRIDSDTDEPVRDEIDLRLVARSAAGVLQPLALTNDIQVVVVEPPEAQIVTGDPAAIERVIINLLSNAIKFTESGSRITLSWGAAEPDATTLSVSDTGSGIPPEDLDHVFDRFHRASNAVASAAPGTGLGLAIVKSITEQHGGTVSVSSELGLGTTFTVRLPRSGVTADLVLPGSDSTRRHWS